MAKGKGSKKSDDSKLFAFLAVLLSIIGFVIALAAKRDDKYVMYYAKQSLVLFFGWIIVWIIGAVIGFIPVVGSVVYYVLSIGLLILWILGLVYSVSGEMKAIPIVGQFAGKFNF